MKAHVRHGWAAGGILAFVLGTIGIFLPIMPTVPFYILAAFCWGKGHPEWEARLLTHPRFGPPIVAWRERGAISLLGKVASITMLSGSAIGGLILLETPWSFVPLGIAVVTSVWIATRPS